MKSQNVQEICPSCRFFAVEDQPPSAVYPPRMESASELPQLSTASEPRAAFDAARFRRVEQVDDATLDGLMRNLVALRRIKFGIAGTAFVLGAACFGVVETPSLLYTALIHLTLGSLAFLPSLAIGSLAVRRLFLKAASEHGLSRGTALLLLTRAERRARGLSPLLPTEARLTHLSAAVREWDRA